MRALALAALLAVSSVSGKPVYVCPMEEHPQEFDQPGKCPICGMDLVEKKTRLQVAVLLFDGAEIIDYAGPYEVLGDTGAKVFTVAPRSEPIRSVYGLVVKPDFDLEHAPPADVLIVPGGGIDKVIGDPKAIEWVRQRAASSKFVLSVCNGAFILAQAGLLDGLSATTTASNLDKLGEVWPKIHVVRDERFTDNGKIITSGGLSAGIDGALHLVERIYGRQRAEDVARDIEYHWQPDSKWARGALADAMLPDVRLPDGASWKKLLSTGDTDRWEVRGELKVPMKSEDFLDLSARQITAHGWKLQRSRENERTFVKTDRTGRTWRASFVASTAEDPSAFLETMTIERVRP
jgi:putative intracellular protease/amidase